MDRVQRQGTGDGTMKDVANIAFANIHAIKVDPVYRGAVRHIIVL